ncbi:MAG: Crp/Fnr family transcriptional regulator [Betaproteobacteria bacterium]
MENNPSCKECPLRKSSAFKRNTDEEIAFIQKFKTRQFSHPAGALIISEGLPSEDLYTLYAGWAFRFKSLSDGRRQILNFLLPGDFIGLQEKLADVSPHGVAAITTVSLCRFDRSGLWELYRNHPGLGYDVTWIAANQKAVLDENLLSVGRRNATERVATLLVQLYKRMKAIGLAKGASIDFPINQQHIADALGLSLVHTNKTLRKLAKMGFHQISDGQLTVHNPAALQRLADYYSAEESARPLI